MRGIVALACLIGALIAVPARAEDPPLVNWPAMLPGFAQSFTPSTFDTCRDGDPSCIDRTLAEMRRRIRGLDAQCSDNALFARNYLMITEFIKDAMEQDPPFYREPKYLAHEDAVFAQLYWQAEDNWQHGRRDQVPEAWRIAFQAADDKRVQGAGNLMLGINAHVQRDMPYLLAGLGLVDPQGRSRKPDHDKGNEILNTGYDDVLAQAIAEDDPDLAFYDAPGTQVDNFLLFQTIAGWREGVWRNAERLAAARTDAERRLVGESIEQWAASQAREIEQMFRYGGPFTRTRRDALCAKRRERAATPPARRAAECSPRLLGARTRGRRIVVRAACAAPVSVARRTKSGKCQYVTQLGRLGKARRCALRSRIRVDGRRALRLPPGRYVVRGPGLTKRLRLG